MEELIQLWPLDYRSADMLPIIEVMAERFLDGADAYQIIPEIWNGIQPIYLPGMWLPFVVPKILSIDVRWMTWTLLYAGSILALRPWLTTKYFVIVGVSIFYFWLSLFFFDDTLLPLSEEGIVIAYYLFLCWAIYKKNGILIGIAAALCLMSRYSLAPWWIMICGLTLLLGPRRLFLQMSISCIIGILLLMTIGRAWAYLEVFQSMPDNYLQSIIENKWKYNDLIQSSLGIAQFYKYEHLGNLHSVMKVMTFVVPFTCGIIYFYRKHRISWSLFALLSLKLSLVVFYNLLILPYSYLFYTSTVVSIFMLSVVLEGNHKMLSQDHFSN